MRQAWRYAAGAVIIAVPVLVLEGFGLLSRRDPLAAGIGLWALLLTPVAVGAGNALWRRWLFARSARLAGWIRVRPRSREWPWAALVQSGRTRVSRAWDRPAAGFPITVGEVRYSGGALAGAVPGRSGKALFVVVTLPAPQAPMSMRLLYEQRGNPPKRLRDAYANGELPVWTTRDDQLFTFEYGYSRLTPQIVEESILRALRVVDLLTENACG